MTLKKLAFFVIISFGLFSCMEESEPRLFRQTQIFDIDNGVFNTNSYIESGDAHSGKKISRADSGSNFGFGYSTFLPDSLVGKELAVDVDLWVRTGDLTNTCEFIVSANSNDSMLVWQGCGVKNSIKAPGEWSNVIYTVNFPSSLTSMPNFKISLLAHNIDAKSYFDIDDLKFTIYEKTSGN